MTSGSTTLNRSTRLVLTDIPDSWAWIRTDLLVRILPFVVAFAVAYVFVPRRAALGLSSGWFGVQLLFALVAAPLMFAAATWVQLQLTRRRGMLGVPANAKDAWFQAGFYVVNGPVEEAFFRGLVQGGLGLLWGAPAGFVIATVTYVLYHRLGRWPWPDTFATALGGVPLRPAVAAWGLARAHRRDMRLPRPGPIPFEKAEPGLSGC